MRKPASTSRSIDACIIILSSALLWTTTGSFAARIEGDNKNNSPRHTVLVLVRENRRPRIPILPFCCNKFSLILLGALLLNYYAHNMHNITSEGPPLVSRVHREFLCVTDRVTATLPRDLSINVNMTSHDRWEELSKRFNNLAVLSNYQSFSSIYLHKITSGSTRPALGAASFWDF